MRRRIAFTLAMGALWACGDTATSATTSGGGDGRTAASSGTGDGDGGSGGDGAGAGQGATSVSSATSAESTTVGAPGAGGGAGGEAAGGGGAGSGGGGPTEPDIDTIPWETGEDVGFGVARKDTQNPQGESAFIGYAGYGIGPDAARAWVTELYRATLRDRGVRYVFAVRGPADPGYGGLEIGNSKIAASLGVTLTASTGFVLVLGHSSGSFVAHELLRQLEQGLDPGAVTADRVVYFNLDGGLGGLTQPAVDRLRRAYFVGALDPGTGTASPNRDDMVAGGSIYAAAGGYREIDAAGAGCAAGATWCVHMTPITTMPHDPNDGSEVDYLDFDGRPVAQAFIEAEALDAGL